MRNATKAIALPIRISGGTWEELEREHGIVRTGAQINIPNFHQVELAVGYDFTTSNVSRHQMWLVDGDVVIAKVFLKEHLDRGNVQVLTPAERFVKPAVHCSCQTCSCNSRSNGAVPIGDVTRVVTLDQVEADLRSIRNMHWLID